jgi:hypothetical protein
MLAGRADEHRGLFRRRQAEFFAGFGLRQIATTWPRDQRAAIAAAGSRCLEGRYDNAARLTAVLESFDP